ncbi:MAG: hypothetical protein AAGI44_13060 [Pseudomonadota bacterium]
MRHLLFCISFVCWGVTAQTEVPHVFSDGEVIDAQKFNENFDALEQAIDSVPAGPQGELGPQGEPGPEGQQGPEGKGGTKGPQGEQGPEGPQGPIGLTGAPGPPGPTGMKGDQGVQGLQGEQGPQGEPGLTGSGVRVLSGVARTVRLTPRSPTVMSTLNFTITGTRLVVFDARYRTLAVPSGRIFVNEIVRCGETLIYEQPPVPGDYADITLKAVATLNAGTYQCQFLLEEQSGANISVTAAHFIATIYPAS